MANVDRVNGFKPVGHIHGSGFNGECRIMSVAAAYGTALFVGDPVIDSGTADADGVNGVEQCAAGGIPLGVIIGVVVPQPGGAQEHPGYIAASTGGYVLVNVDPGTIYEVQEDGVGGAIGIAGSGEMCDHVIAAGNTTTGTSGAELNSSDVGTGIGWKILGFSQRPDNEPANVNAKVLVKANEHALGSDAAAV